MISFSLPCGKKLSSLVTIFCRFLVTFFIVNISQKKIVNKSELIN